jgi:hypothetical protein
VNIEESQFFSPRHENIRMPGEVMVQRSGPALAGSDNQEIRKKPLIGQQRYSPF